ncbi:MAG: VOC family protein [Chloroflexota bacterium]
MTHPTSPIGAIDHVAIVVRSIEASLPRYRALFGLEPDGDVIELAAQHARLLFLPTGPWPAARLELVEPTDEASGVGRFLASRGEGLHHVCFRSADLPRDLAGLVAAEAELIDATPRPGAHAQVAFLHPRTLNGVLWELAAVTEEVPPDA